MFRPFRKGCCLRVPLPRVMRRFVCRDDGATAVEFAMLALPFLGLLFALIQTALIFFAQQTLETAVADSARLVLTGQVQKVNKDELKKLGMTELDNFRKEVCSRIYALFECDASNKGTSGLIVDVRAGTSFSDLGSPPLKTDQDIQNLRKNPSYQPGGPGSIVSVQLVYEWPLYFGLEKWFGTKPTDKATRLLVATSVFRNEPFPAAAPSN